MVQNRMNKRVVAKSKKPLRANSVKAESAPKSLTGGAARNFNSFAREMKGYLPGMSAGERDTLLRDLYWLSKFKNNFDLYIAGEREGAKVALVYRKYRLWLANLDKELGTANEAIKRAADIANQYPKRAELGKIDFDESDLDQNELQKLVVGKTFRGLARAGNEIDKVRLSIERFQYSLAAVVNPKLRTRVEKKLVPKEPRGLQHHLLLGEKTRKIDLAFLNRAASMLDEYHNKDGKAIRPRDHILAAVWRVAFGKTKTEESIRRNLSPSRRKKL